MQSDDRLLSPLKLSLSAAEMDTTEPFVTYAEFNENTDFADYYCINRLFKYCFCVSDELKEMLDIYGDNIKTVPFFITDKNKQSQRIYWKVDIEVQDCLEIKPKMICDYLTIIKEKIKNKYIFRVEFDRQQYIVVSLHLAENILRKNMCGIKFIPVSLK